MNSKQLILSIIVPVYNVEKYLRDCLDSLLMQDLSENEYEIICVNDGSKDSSAAILDEYAEKHANIRVIHKENGGVSSARNRGIEEARGEYIAFVDADDYLRVGALEQIVQYVRSNAPDALQLRAEVVTENSHFNPTQQRVSLSYQNISLNGAESYMFFTCWELIIKRSLFEEHNLRFVEHLAYGEDTVFGFYVWQIIDDIIRMDKPIYHYRMRQGSAVHQYSKKAMSGRVRDLLYRARVFEEYMRQTDESSCRYKTALSYQKRWTLGIMNALLLSDTSISETLNEMKKYNMPQPFCHSLKTIFSKGYSMKERIGMLKNTILMKNMTIYKFWAYFFRIIPIYRWMYCLFRMIYV